MLARRGTGSMGFAEAALARGDSRLGQVSSDLDPFHQVEKVSLVRDQWHQSILRSLTKPFEPFGDWRFMA